MVLQTFTESLATHEAQIVFHGVISKLSKALLAAFSLPSSRERIESTDRRTVLVAFSLRADLQRSSKTGRIHLFS